MSNEAPNWFQDVWDDQVTYAFQKEGHILAAMTMPPRPVPGKQLHFSIAGKGAASSYVRGQQLQPMNATRGEKLLQAGTFYAADFAYDWDLDRMRVDEAQAISHSAGLALGRRADNIAFTPLVAADFITAGTGQSGQALTSTGGNNVTVLTTGNVGSTVPSICTPELLLAGRRKIFNSDVPVDDGMLFCGLPPIAFDTMMQKQVFSNSQWIGPTDMPFADNMRKRSWQGVHFFELPSYLQTSEDGTVNTFYDIANPTRQKFYMWHRAALGFGTTGDAAKNEFIRYPRELRWWWQSTISGGATIVQPPGIIEFRIDSAILPTYT